MKFKIVRQLKEDMSIEGVIKSLPNNGKHLDVKTGNIVVNGPVPEDAELWDKIYRETHSNDQV